VSRFECLSYDTENDAEIVFARRSSQLKAKYELAEDIDRAADLVRLEGLYLDDQGAFVRGTRKRWDVLTGAKLRNPSLGDLHRALQDKQQRIQVALDECEKARIAETQVYPSCAQLR
jgi:hypothetical protein